MLSDSYINSRCIDELLKEGHCGIAHTECMIWCRGEDTLKPSRRVGDREDECWSRRTRGGRRQWRARAVGL